MKMKITVLVLAALLPRAASVHAQEFEMPLTLDEAIGRGLAASLRLAEADARGDAAGAVVARTEAGRRPQVAAEAGYTRTNHVDEFGVLMPNGQLRIIYPDIPDNYRTRLGVQWPVYTSGRLAVERAARTEADAIAAERDAVGEDLRLEIARAYWTLVTSSETVRVVEAALARTTAHLTDVRNQLAAGLAAPNDVLTVEAQQAHQRMLVIRAQADRDSAGADLARLVGADPAARITPTTALTDGAAAPVPATVDALAEQARRQRADRAAIVERLEAIAARRTAAAAGLRPAIALAGGVEYAQPNPRIFPRQDEWRTSWDASVNVTWPLSDGGRTRADVAEVDAQARALGARLQEFDRVLVTELGHRLRDIAASRAAIEAADVGVRAAAEARRVAADRFSAGVATNTDVLAAQAALLRAELDRMQALAALRIAQARLQRVLGR